MPKCGVCDGPVAVWYIGKNDGSRHTYQLMEHPRMMAAMEQHMRQAHADVTEVGMKSNKCTCKLGLLPCPKHGWFVK